MRGAVDGLRAEDALYLGSSEGEGWSLSGYAPVRDSAAQFRVEAQILGRLVARFGMMLNIQGDVFGQTDDLPLAEYAFPDRVATPVRRAQHGDSSGVRGAAWLWSG